MIKSPLPVRSGVSPSRLYLPKEDWPNLLSFLEHRFSHLSQDQIIERLSLGLMVNSLGQRIQVNSPYEPETWLWYYRQVDDEIPVPFEMPIIFEDELLIVVDKPHFLASIPGGRYLQETALIRLRRLKNNYDIAPIHRLDRDTAGVLIFTKLPQYRGAYQRLFEQKSVHKVYEAIAPFRQDIQWPYRHVSRIQRSQHYFIMQEVQGVANSETLIDLIQVLPNHRALYRLEPKTGKKHQLRVHMNALSMPIENDVFYPVLQPASAQDEFDKPLKLLAREVQFMDPVIGIVRIFKSHRLL